VHAYIEGVEELRPVRRLELGGADSLQHGKLLHLLGVRGRGRGGVKG